MRKIIYKERFEKELIFIVEFIAQNDGYHRAEKFYSEIYEKIENIPFMPYRFRQNQTTNNTNIRDLIYKGYIIPFRITPDTIEVLGIYKDNLWIKQ
ncbi:MAG: type II toxin-antitoxin system RelE/ParE family toxin [Neisseriaceae bacterium]|nr:type II toxin-antitoxin system RelE/ParE family toxin [Neisseriaceae bacterium]